MSIDVPRRWRRLALLGAALGWSMTAEAADVTLSVPGGFVTLPVTSFAEQRFRGVVRQAHDFSCGSAALATLLTHHYGRPTTEETVFNDMIAHGDRVRIERQGFSMLDMKGYLERNGYDSDGFRADLDALSRAGVPAIAVVTTGGYAHFVVVKGVEGSRVLLADPARGNRVVDRETFQAQWNGILFAITDHIGEGRSTFNTADTWHITPRAPIGIALSSQSLSSFVLALPRGRNFF